MFHNVGTKEKLVDRVVDEIQTRIVEGGMEPGSMLPPERELCEQLGVSRTVLREAVRMLVSKGLLETRPGVGTIVKQVGSQEITESLSLLMNQDPDLTLTHLHSVRLMLESQIARLAAMNASEEDIARLTELTNGMERALDDTEEFSYLDAEYHRTLAQATQNPLLVVLMDSIRELFLDILTKIQYRDHQVNMTLPDHRKIIAMVNARDPDGAEQAMRDHLDHAFQIMQERYLDHQ